MELDVKRFSFSDQPEPHRQRTKDILSAYPEVRKLIGRNPYSFLIIIFVVALQILISISISNFPWWYSLLTAYILGAFANHCLFVLIHECSHNLIFKNRSLNKLASIIADIPNVLPSAISFKSYHLKHHSFQGHYDLDADLASNWEAKLIGNSFIGKVVWEFFFPIFQSLRTPRLKKIKFLNIWTFINWIVLLTFDLFIINNFGLTSFLYLVFSFFFSVGLHPLGARWIQEHFLTSAPQETYSYYGILNIPALNVGYHNEHHDFPSVPWNRLPKLKRMAPEFYDNLVFHKSWFKLWIRFLFDRNLSLFSRVVRSNKNNLSRSD